MRVGRGILSSRAGLVLSLGDVAPAFYALTSTLELKGWRSTRRRGPATNECVIWHQIPSRVRQHDRGRLQEPGSGTGTVSGTFSGSAVPVLTSFGLDPDKGNRRAADYLFWRAAGRGQVLTKATDVSGTWSAPVVANGRIYLCYLGKLTGAPLGLGVLTSCGRETGSQYLRIRPSLAASPPERRPEARVQTGEVGTGRR